MTIPEALDLLGIIAALDGRMVTETQGEVWAKVLDAYTFAECERAVIRWHQTMEGRRILPVDVVKLVKASKGRSGFAIVHDLDAERRRRELAAQGLTMRQLAYRNEHLTNGHAKPVKRCPVCITTPGGSQAASTQNQTFLTPIGMAA